MSVVAALSVVSSVQYVTHWKDTMPGKPYFAALLNGIRSGDDPVPLVDDVGPQHDHVAAGLPGEPAQPPPGPLRRRRHFVDVSTDHLNVVDSNGDVVPAQISFVRGALPGPSTDCGYSVKEDDVTVPLNDPVAFGGWWVRIGYLSSGRSPVVITAGASSYSTVVEPGVHAIYFRGGDQFDSVVISGLADGVRLCTDDVIVGHPAPAETSETTS